MAGESLPYGIRDVKLYTLTAAGVKGTGVDLPNSRKLSFEEAEEFSELRGDDKVVTKRGNGPSVNWELEAGGISLDCLVILNGGGITTSGTGATAKNTYKKKVTDQRPHFAAEGQSISEAGGDFHVVLYNMVADGGVSGEFSDGNFFLTGCSGTAFASLAAADNSALYDFVQNITAAPIV
jgi:hypothetical protein